MSDSSEEASKNSCSLIDVRTYTLNHGESFGVFDGWGNISPFSRSLQGVFHKGTRFISRMEMYISRHKPLTLSSTIREDNDVFRVDLVNPTLKNKSSSLEKSSIHIKRVKFIVSGVVYEKISFKSYARENTEIMLEVDVDTDFKDIFELRGFKRKSELGVIKKRVNDDCLELIYEGQDKIERKTIVSSDTPCRFSEQGLCFEFDLGSKQEKEIEINYNLFFQGEEPKRLGFEPAKKVLEDEIKDLKTMLGKVRTSNEQFNHWLNRSSIDLVSLMAEHDKCIYPNAGVPWYNTVFGRDGLITAIQTLTFAPLLAKGVIKFLAKNQALDIKETEDSEPGKILHEIREGELANLEELPFRRYYGSVDTTPVFVWLCGLYYERTGDIETIRSIWPQIKYALQWLDKFGDEDQDGYIEYYKKSPNGLDNQGWKDSFDSVSHKDGRLLEGSIALCEVQGYAYQAKLHGYRLAMIMSEQDLSDSLKEQANSLKEKFNKDFWDDSIKFVPLALDGKKNPALVISSNPGHCLATEILERDKAAIVIDKLFSPELFSGWGIRTLGTEEARYNPMSYHNGSIWPHDNSLIALGLSKYRDKKRLLTLATAIFDASLFLDLQRIPELFCGFERVKGEGPTLYPVACSPQAWAVGSVFIFITALLGIEISATKKQINFNYPTLPKFLDVLELKELYLSDSESFSCRCIRYGDDVGVDILSIPEDWDMIIKK